MGRSSCRRLAQGSRQAHALSAVNISILKRAALSLGFFVAVYAPAFACVALVRPPVTVAIPLIIVVSAAIACLIIALRAHDAAGIAAFGIRRSPLVYLAIATVAGVPIGFALAWLTARYP